MTKLNTYLNFAGNTEEAFSFYKSVFGGDFASVVRFKDMPMANQVWGDYYGSFMDKFGVLWMVNYSYPKPK